MASESFFIYDLFRAFWTRVVGLFFREIAERNAHLIPKTGPVMFVAAPHHNQFVDPVILLMHAARRVYYLTAAASMRRKFIGFYGRCLRGIPVERQQDLATRGLGSIRLEDRYAEPTLITGTGTKFTEQVKPGMKIVLPKDAGQSKVDEVISDTQLRISREMKELEALEALTKPEGSTYKVVPHIDQDDMYRSVYQRFDNGECVGIFPEGGSHDRTEMLPLKAGVTIMALGATAANPDVGLKIVPTGLNYFHPSKFRSRAVIDFGQPIDVPPELVEKYKRGGSERREACDELLKTVSEGLKQVTLNTPDLETLKLIQAGRRLYQPNLHSLTMAQQVELTRRFIKGYDVYRDLPEVKELRERIEDYNMQLRYYGIRDHQVSTMQVGRVEAGALFIWRLVWLVIMGLVALPGTIINTPVFVITGVVSKRKARAALAASTVKVRARDVIATWKILIALVLVPSLYTAYSLLAVLFVRRAPRWALAALAGVSEWSSFRIYVWAWGLVAFMSYTALVFGEQAIDIVKSIRPLFLTLILGKEHTGLLVQDRQELSDDITDLVNELAPKIYPEFLKTRVKDQLGESRTTHSNIINESADAFHRRMRSGEQALRQRLSTIGGGDVGDDVDSGRGRRKSKYSFNPPTPRTMATLNSISPLEFLTTATAASPATSPRADQEESRDHAENDGSAQEADSGRGSSSDGVRGQHAGIATPKARNGLFDL
ncbi:Glycerol-3-phosphate/dihydroxyacetone phosphate acyltransferase [Coemansia sp. RSA 1813]|nr:Glycerol-3-phosphate/dihydroxyacetone phosphate acyltransferase [Coemansia sp. RSA 1646]KAJ1767207.1 Glycerol-3-phosphate/dihydroxyacetone phosphate acyltransferase [Coemansia sp. RSA 1843]KAJ2086212.1 Glycerol-3-phosphate/dihydroxyacetone phosphate acyltransferase [Coemansia sp. RSA 986]KAJ2212948.1 Glycerol-3-phosphate/dihydroxyacetone phosphate acyltransferase [Coemansia sp. RSA 487]KAJ2567624.1 Glycerol-3-phosphate/dihydroxyacetone phosphate acyltransferase [Coemansia sp. RSA 1813]